MSVIHQTNNHWHNVLHISIKCTETPINLSGFTKAQSWTLKLSPFSSSAHTTFMTFLTYLLNKLHRLKFCLMCLQQMPWKHRLPVLESRNGAACQAPSQQRLPTAPSDFSHQLGSTIHTSPSEGAPQITKPNYPKVLIKIQAGVIIA